MDDYEDVDRAIVALYVPVFLGDIESSCFSPKQYDYTTDPDFLH